MAYDVNNNNPDNIHVPLGLDADGGKDAAKHGGFIYQI